MPLKSDFKINQIFYFNQTKIGDFLHLKSICTHYTHLSCIKRVVLRVIRYIVILERDILVQDGREFKMQKQKKIEQHYFGLYQRLLEC